MNSRVFWAVFGCLASLLYVPAYWWVWAPVVYYPLTGEFTITPFFSNPSWDISQILFAPRLEKESGPGMTWYGWIISAAMIALPVAVVASLFKNPAVERFVFQYAWLLVAIAIVITVILDSKFLFFM